MGKLVILLMLLASASYGQTITNVSGTIGDSEEVTITGTSFGTKSPAAPALWDDFEAGTVGNAVETPVIGSDYYWSASTYASTGYGSSQYALSSGNGIGLAGLSHYWGSGTHRRAFASMDVYLTGTDVNGANLKILRINPAYDGTSVEISHGYPNMNVGKEIGSTSLYAIGNHGMSPTYAEYCDGYASFPWTNWNMTSVWAYTGTAGNTDGLIGRCIGGTWDQTANREQASDSGATGALDGFRNAYFCCYAQNSTVVHIDNVYADSTIARVELCNDDDYTTATIRRPLPPTSWSATSIVVTCYTYGFSADDDAWIFVHDASGNRSAAYAVTINEAYEGGGTPDNAAPGAPGFTRNGDNAAITWTAAIVEGVTHVRHQLDVFEGGVPVNVVVGDVTAASITIPAADDVTASVSALDADGVRLSTSSTTTSNGT